MGNGKSCAAKSPQELLDEFARTGQQAPFEEIVRRYAGMVFHVCHQITKNNHDAEDATQAVFLTLAIQLKTGKQIRSPGPWLQQVAYRLAIDVRKAQKRRTYREEIHAKCNGKLELDSASQLDMSEMRQTVVDELNKLPTKYRLPLILHYFGGLSRDELARELKCKPKTLGVRLHRARQLLGERLSGRGVAMAGGVLAVATMEAVHEAVSESLVASTCHAAAVLASGHELGPGVVSAQVLTLVRGAARAMIFTKAKTAAILLLMAGSAVAAGAQVVAKVATELRLPSPAKLRDSITAPLRPSVPKLRVDAGTSQVAPARPDRPGDLAAAPMNVGPAIEFPCSPPAVPSFQLVRDGPRYSVEWNRIWPERLDAPAVYRGPVRSELAANRLAPSGPVMGGSGFAARNWPQSSGFASSWATAPVWMAAGNQRGTGVSGPGRPGRPVRQMPVVHREPVQGPLQNGPRIRGQSLPTPNNVTFAGMNLPPGQQPTGGLRGPSAPQPGIPSGTGIAMAPQDITLRANGPVSLVHWGSPGIVTNYYSGGLDCSIGYADAVFARQGDSLSVHGSGPNATTVLMPFDPTRPQPTWQAGNNSLIGYGRLDLGVLDNSGKVIATGSGVDRELDLSSAIKVLNSQDNQLDGGVNGWYAQWHGKLRLPAVPVDPLTHTATWGEESDDGVLDLVNSVRATFRSEDAPAMMNLSLLATDRTDLPGLPSGRASIGVWAAEDGALRNVDLTIRYDEYTATLLARNERFLELWGYDGAWHELSDVHVDIHKNLISGHADAASYFAVTTPEPGAMLTLTGAAMLLMRRQRREKR